MPDLHRLDAYSPKEVADRVETTGVIKARLPLLQMFVLGILAGGFIGLGALYFTIVASDPGLGFAAQRLLGGLAFSLGLVLVVVGGAELFTGNNLLVMAWVAGRISGKRVLRNLVVVYAGNFIGAAGLAFMVLLSGHMTMADGAIGETAARIAVAKTSLPFIEALFRGILCNILVCLAVWLTYACRNVVDKIVALIFPISAFVAAGFEHCIANMYFIPLAIFLFAFNGEPAPAGVDWQGFAGNLLPVTLGNLIGGSVLVGLVYYLVYHRDSAGNPD